MCLTKLAKSPAVTIMPKAALPQPSKPFSLGPGYGFRYKRVQVETQNKPGKVKAVPLR